MDAEAYLIRHGWKGSGHSLQPHKSTSLSKPLLVSKKVDVLGVGLNKHDSLSDQWWLRAFDSSLKNLGTGEKGALDAIKEHGIKRGGLLGRFVKGETFGGTLGIKPVEAIVFDATKPDTSISQRVSSVTSELEGSMSEKNMEFSEGMHPDRMQAIAKGTQHRAVADGNPDGKKRKAASIASDTGEKSKKRRLSSGKSTDGAEKEPQPKEKKKDKIARQLALREQKRQARYERLRTQHGVTTDEELQKIIKAQENAEKKRRKELRLLKEKKQQERAELRAAAQKKKAERREAGKAQKKIVDKLWEERKLAEGKIKPSTEEGDVFSANQDVVALDPGRKVYATKGEKKQKKMFAESVRRGVPFEQVIKEHQEAMAAREVEKKEQVDRRRAEKAGISLDLWRTMPAGVSAMQVAKRLRELSELDEEKRKRYAERAEVKKQSLETYFVRRAVKNEKHQQEVKAAAKRLQLLRENDAFTVDELNPTALLGRIGEWTPQETLDRLDPSMWAGRAIAKEWRQVKLRWMRARRAVRKGLADATPMSKLSLDGKKTVAKARAARKIQMQEELGRKILEYNRARIFSDRVPDDEQLTTYNGERFPNLAMTSRKGKFTAREQQEGRKAARRLLRHEKQKTKRGKNEAKSKKGKKN